MHAEVLAVHFVDGRMRAGSDSVILIGIAAFVATNQLQFFPSSMEQRNSRNSISYMVEFEFSFFKVNLNFPLRYKTHFFLFCCSITIKNIVISMVCGRNRVWNRVRNRV